MEQHRSVCVSGVLVLVVVELLAISGISRAENFAFRVAFDEIPGINEIEAGDLASAIQILEAQSKNRAVPAPGNVLATLCGAYVLNASLRKAAETCDKAVALAPSVLAYNNRGVLRVHSGDLDGARADFDRARPERIDEHLEYLQIRDIGVIADGNFDLLEELTAGKSRAKVDTALAVNPASTENVLH